MTKEEIINEKKIKGLFIINNTLKNDLDVANNLEKIINQHKILAVIITDVEAAVAKLKQMATNRALVSISKLEKECNRKLKSLNNNK